MSGCFGDSTSSKTPTETMLEYHAFSKTNLDFNKETSYYTEAMRKEVEEKMPLYVERMKLDSIDAAKQRYMKFNSQTAKCMELKPVTQNVNGDVAKLEFTAIDLCTEVSEGDERQTAKQVVTMKNESGWKIDKSELVL